MISDKLHRPPTTGPREGHPILAGLVAFAAVVVVVAGVVGGGALVASRALGLSEDGSIDTGGSEQQTLFLPKPSETEDAGEPYITLPPQPQSGKTKKPKNPFTESPAPLELITLRAAQTAVAPMEPIDLTGEYPAGEGAVLRVQQFEGGAWTDFPVTAPVSGGDYATFIQTGAVGLNRFRMIDTDTGESSNEVKVQIG
ncbi:hypothetical protein BH09ACT12_BH09ACT12_01380 [soil metagenome]